MHAIGSDEWVEALESEVFRQVNGSLKKNDGYCCLGVAAFKAGARFGSKVEDEGYSPCYASEDDFFADRNSMSGTIHERVWEEMGEVGTLIGLFQSSFTQMNDNLGWSFKEIAEWIRGVMDGSINPDDDPSSTDIHRRHLEAEAKKCIAVPAPPDFPQTGLSDLINSRQPIYHYKNPNYA